MSRRKSTVEGFTLIELMIVIAIIGILAAAAVPQYAQYTKKAKFAEVISKTAEHKSAVHMCVQELNTLNGCSSGMNGMPPAITAPTGYIKSLTVANGLITSTATSLLDENQFILTSSYNPATNAVSWTVSGSCLTAHFCKQ